MDNLYGWLSIISILKNGSYAMIREFTHISFPRHLFGVWFAILLIASTSLTFPALASSPIGLIDAANASSITLMEQTESTIRLGFESPILAEQARGSIEELTSSFFADFEQVSLGAGRNIPAVSYFVLIPPTGGVTMNIDEIQSSPLPELVKWTSVEDVYECDTPCPLPDDPLLSSGLYPAEPVMVSPPAIMRGYRLVKVTFYPIQYDAGSETFQSNTSIRVSLNFGGIGFNEVSRPDRPRPSQSVNRLIRSVVINPPEAPLRDDGEEDGAILYIAGVSNEAAAALEPLLEWRRRSGRKVELLSLQNAFNPEVVKAAILDAYENWETPLEAVVLCGEARDVFVVGFFNYNPGGYTYETDHPFACLEGDDLLPEIAVGRIPFNSIGELQGVVRKIIQYESEPFIGEGNAAGWQQRAAFCASDPRSGQSSIDVCKWAGSLVRRHGYDEIMEGYYQNNNAFNPTDFFQQSIMTGFNILAYRGWMQMSGFSADQIMNFRNGSMLPFVILATCNTGDYYDHYWGYTWTERFLWNAQGGAIGAVGTSGATSCQYNNMMISGIMRSIYALGVKSQGWALMGGKLDIYNSYSNRGDRPHPEVDDTENWVVTTWIYNLMGDPATDLFTHIPKAIAVDHLEDINAGETEFSVLVTDADDQEVPIAGAKVCLYIPEVMQEVGCTDDEGRVHFVFDPIEHDVEEVYLTVTGENLMPYLTDFQVADREMFIGYRSSAIDDGGDQIVNPGDLIDIEVEIANFGQARPEGQISVWFLTDDDRIEILNNQAVLEAAPEPGEGIPVMFSFSLSHAFKHLEEAEFRILVTSQDAEWTSYFSLPVVSSKLEFDAYFWEGDPLRPGEFTDISLQIKNVGMITSPEVGATLFPVGNSIDVIDNFGRFNEINRNEASISDDLFQVSASLSVPAGGTYRMGLELASDEGFIDTLYFSLTLDTAESNQAFGPDKYGYICIDNTDEVWFNAPEYDWVEIIGDGVRLDLNDASEEQDASMVIDLPFTFPYYGERFDRATVCTNGWIAMGSQGEVTTGRNENIPGGMVSSGMICPFWDDLIQDDNNDGVYIWFDEENHRFIVEWKMKKLVPNGEYLQNFELILYDPEFYPSLTGDGEILFQYADVNDNRFCIESWDTPWATVGIGSVDQTDGIAYSYWGELTPGAAPLEDGRAILFTTFMSVDVGVVFGSVHDAESDEPIAGAMVLSNFGFIARTDEEGNYRMENVATAVRHFFTASAPGYNDSTLGEFDVIADEELRVDFRLLRPEFRISQDRFISGVDSGETATIAFSISNPGNGILNWKAETRLVGDADADPWDIRRTYSLYPITNDTRIEGVVFANDLFYISGANDADSNLIYVMNQDGTLLDSIYQVESGRYGYKDLEWDVDRIWAAGEDSIYAFNTSGEVVSRWVDQNQTTSYIACNSDEGILYLSSTTTNISRFDRQGNRLDGYLNRMGMRIYGLGYWAEDPDGYALYIVHKIPESGCFISKMSVETEDTMNVFALPVMESSSGWQSLAITNQFDIYSWVLMTIDNRSPDVGGDVLALYQLAGRKDWMNLSTEEGEIAAGGEIPVELTLDARSLPDTTFRGELVITHNARGGNAVFPIEMWIGYNDLEPADGLSPQSLRLVSSYPNPFNYRTTISFELPMQGRGSISIYDVQGRVVEQLLSSSEFEAGAHTITWHAKAAGVYFAALEFEFSIHGLERRVQKLVCLP